MAAPRKAKTADAAAAAGYRLEEAADGTFMLVDASTGTHQAADWTRLDGHGLTLDEIDAVLAN